MPVIWRNLTLDFPVFCFSPLQVSFQNQVLVSSEPQQPFHRLQAWQKRQPSTLKELLDTAEAWKEWVEKAEIKPGLTVTACNDIYCRLSSLTDVPMYHLCLSCVGDVIFSGWQWQRGLIQLEKKKKKKICYVFFPTPTHTIGWARGWHLTTCRSHLDDVLVGVLVIRRDKKPDKDRLAVLTAYLCQCLQQVKLRLHPPRGRAQRIAQNRPAEVLLLQILQQRFGILNLQDSCQVEERWRSRIYIYSPDTPDV